jgi:hypothetical protein
MPGAASCLETFDAVLGTFDRDSMIRWSRNTLCKLHDGYEIEYIAIHPDETRVASSFSICHSAFLSSLHRGFLKGTLKG